MEKQIYKISPFLEPRIWGGDRILKNFNYQTDLYPIGEVYNVVALPGEADCKVEGTDLTLSELYRDYPDWFKCDTEQLPIRVNLLDPLADLSVQLHPDDAYALVHDHSRGKPEAWVILDTPEDGKIEFGHHAHTREEFKTLADAHDWGKLLKYLPAKKDYFIDIPAGTLHAIGRDVLTYNISRNADLTYRLFDYDRIDPNTKEHRELHIDKVVDNVLVPDTSKGFVWYEPYLKSNCEVTDYWDEPGLYGLSRVKVKDFGFYDLARFAFITVVDGEGTINNTPVIKGETVLIPDGISQLKFTGSLDMFIASYKNLAETRE
ncbi:class I mannose-6-phosphate isomerase [Enterococcus sp. AZ103]|uniref:class I mannose-6-phosphate isomerase n=1 Tax=Enterococcus sp. AZ103 TaxID=2774628 RepID=UPI003F2046F6